MLSRRRLQEKDGLHNPTQETADLLGGTYPTSTGPAGGQGGSGGGAPVNNKLYYTNDHYTSFSQVR